MIELKKELLLEIDGGLSVSGAVLNYLAKGFNTVMDIGRVLGTSIRRIINGNLC